MTRADQLISETGDPGKPVGLYALMRTGPFVPAIR
jgi:hypothetical protein